MPVGGGRETERGPSRDGFQHRRNRGGCRDVLGGDESRSRIQLSTVGVILMIVGGIGLVVSMMVFAVSRRPAGSPHRTFDRETTDTQGDSTSVHEEVH